MQLHRVNSFYDRQIDRALRGARVLCLSDYPRLVLFSDVHRGNGSWSDSFLNNKPLYEAALHYYDARDFACVELGDGDELWESRNITGGFRRKGASLPALGQSRPRQKQREIPRGGRYFL